jgi:hypothetical protein
MPKTPYLGIRAENVRQRRLGAEVHNFGGSFGGSTCRITLNFLLTIIACGHAYRHVMTFLVVSCRMTY